MKVYHKQPSGAQVRALRVARRQTQQEAADSVGAGQGTWQRWETKGGMGLCEWAVYRLGGLDYLYKMAEQGIECAGAKSAYHIALDAKLAELMTLMRVSGVSTEEADGRLSMEEMEEVDWLLAYAPRMAPRG